MTAALNEPCIGEGDSSGVGNGLFFLLLDGILPSSTGSPLNDRFGGRGRAVHKW